MGTPEGFDLSPEILDEIQSNIEEIIKSFPISETNKMDVKTMFMLAVATSIDALAGGVFGTKYKTKAEAAGGVILILIGVKILLEHFGIL